MENTAVVEIVKFKNDIPIHLNYDNASFYKKCNSYAEQAMVQGFAWHQIVWPHKGKRISKSDFLTAIFAAVEPEEFFPIAYRPGEVEDRFLVRNCRPALNKLFEKNLCVQLANGKFLPLEVQLNVGKYTFEQINPTSKIEKALSECYKNLASFGADSILDLSNFGASPVFSDIIVSLGNTGVFKRVCEAIYRNEEQMRKLNGLILSDNHLHSLAALQCFAGSQFAFIDVRDNKLVSATRLCRDLENIHANEILLAGNPIVQDTRYPKCLRPILKNFKLIDGIKSEVLEKNYTPLSEDAEINFENYEIDPMNPANLYKFKNSGDWHAIKVPDAERNFSKETMFDFFFSTVSQQLTPIYPCYYKYEDGEHQFLVRECYDQLEHLVKTKYLELTIPRETCNQDDVGNEPQIENKIIKYALFMNITPYKVGQVEPIGAINKVLSHCYNAIDRVLNLENFQKNFENIVINLSCIHVLNRVLTMAARKFLANCVEIRLACNKILSIKCAKTLNIMTNLRAMDLSNNWIHDVKDIKHLSQLGLKSLCLDGNPLCSKFSFAADYIKKVKQYFPELTKLDKIDVSGQSYYAMQKNYVCDVKCYSLIDYFVPEYYKIFDTDNRVNLEGFYHESALFTLNFCDSKTSNAIYDRIAAYEKYSRDIQKMSDLKRAYTTVHQGPHDIVHVLKSLPNIRHDLFGFTIDATYYTGELLIFTIGGVFMDETESAVQATLLFGFTRTFVLKAKSRNMGALKCASLYYIINDQWNIYPATSQQIKTAFKFQRDGEAKLVKEDNKEEMVAMFQEITALKSIWCTRCLQDANWDFELALKRFKKLWENKQIPDSAYN